MSDCWRTEYDEKFKEKSIFLEVVVVVYSFFGVFSSMFGVHSLVPPFMNGSGSGSGSMIFIDEIIS